MKPPGTHPLRTGQARVIARLCTVLCATQLAIAHAQPVTAPQPLWIVPWAGPAQVQMLPFPTPFWLWPVPWSMPPVPMWLPQAAPTTRPTPVPIATIPADDGAHAAEPAARPVIVMPPPAEDAATGSPAPATGVPAGGVPAVDTPAIDTLVGDVPATDVVPGHGAAAGPAAEPDTPQHPQPGVDASQAKSDAIPVLPSAVGNATDTMTTGTQEPEALPPSAPTRKTKPAPRLKPLPPPKTLGSGSRADTTRNGGGKARKLCWRDGKLDVCP